MDFFCIANFDLKNQTSMVMFMFNKENGLRLRFIDPPAL